MDIIKINPLKPDRSIIKKAADTIKKGGLVVYPTDTAYGIGVDATSEKSIEKLYRIKRRSPNKPTHVVVRDWDMLNALTITNKKAKFLYDKLIPGPLTLILKKKHNSPIPKVLTGGLNTLGVRIPNCEVTKMLSQHLNTPYTTPSANRSGKPATYLVDEVKTNLGLEQIDLVLDAGSLPKNKPSTIIDLSKNTFQILRKGDISPKDIKKAINKIDRTNNAY
jgi:L-threonylcarbamoyladenylate synthase